MRYIAITGGSGGLGRATALYFANKGFHVFSLDLHPCEPSEGIEHVALDVTDTESAEAAVRLISRSTQRLDAVISFAGIYAMDSFIEIPEDVLSHILQVNLMGVYRVNKAFLPLVRDGGRIIITTSELAGHKALPFNGIYTMTKTALEHYADALRIELVLIGVPVTVIRPGAFATDMVTASSSAMERMSANTRLYKTNTERFRRIMATQTGTAKPPEKLARTVFRAVTALHPRPRYTVNPGFLLLLYNALPRSVQVWAIKKLIG